MDLDKLTRIKNDIIAFRDGEQLRENNIWTAFDFLSYTLLGKNVQITVESSQPILNGLESMEMVFGETGNAIGIALKFDENISFPGSSGDNLNTILLLTRIEMLAFFGYTTVTMNRVQGKKGFTLGNVLSTSKNPYQSPCTISLEPVELEK